MAMAQETITNNTKSVDNMRHKFDTDAVSIIFYERSFTFLRENSNPRTNMKYQYTVKQINKTCKTPNR
jgi:hypothetical protein